jgi:hypothetical protein
MPPAQAPRPDKRSNPPPPERRRAERRDLPRVFRCKVTARGGVLGPSAAILDLSAQGVGLLIARSLEVGATVHLRFTHAGTPPLAVPARVAYCTGGDNGRWLLGCEFDRPLTGAQLDALLA